ncbi:hypothetical protein AMTR_s00021p00152600 [Amborella trichopoda]|uniref:Syntaxin N-terminal domain-containing protein n=1 Tax=Amborella trichopoda TaxID=13333 RepID=W1Q0D3_AMBTC|nr:hypothetical protein AMTR_s00021p00152600 [Amborella trichopoda]
MEKQFARLELAIGDGQDEFQEIDRSIGGIVAGLEDLRIDMLLNLNEVADTNNKKVRAAFEKKVMVVLSKLQDQVDELKGNLARCKRAVNNGGGLKRYFEAMSVVVKAPRCIPHRYSHFVVTKAPCRSCTINT